MGSQAECCSVIWSGSTWHNVNVTLIPLQLGRATETFQDVETEPNPTPNHHSHSHHDHRNCCRTAAATTTPKQVGGAQLSLSWPKLPSQKAYPFAHENGSVWDKSLCSCFWPRVSVAESSVLWQLSEATSRLSRSRKAAMWSEWRADHTACLPPSYCLEQSSSFQVWGKLTLFIALIQNHL